MEKLIKYRLEFIFIILQVIEPFGTIGLLLSSLYIFYSIAFKSKLDLISIFILFIPSIALGTSSVSRELGNEVQVAAKWIKIYLPYIKSIFIIGPIAVSVPFLAALAVPVRMLIFYRNNTNRLLTGIWILVLIISIIGTYLAVTSGKVSAGGLTVGFRIALSVGAVLLPLSVNRKDLENQLLVIIKISLVLFLLGFLNGIWKFVAVCFPAYLIFQKEKKIWSMVGVISLLIILFFDFSFTITLTAGVSFLFLLFFNYKKNTTTFFNLAILRYLLFLFPVWFMFLVVFGNMSLDSDSGIFSARFISKIFEDRAPLWMYTLELIYGSNFFLVPAARDVIVYDYSKIGEDAWGVGAHNIYLETARHLGVFATLLISLIIGYILLNSLKISRYNMKMSKFILPLFVTYIVWGLTGNALMYDGSGFLYWLIVGQIYQAVVITKKEKIQILSNITDDK